LLNSKKICENLRNLRIKKTLPAALAKK